MYRVGVDLGGTNIVAGVVDEYYKIIGKGKRKTACPRPAGEILKDIALCVQDAVRTAKIDMEDVVSIGIGTPGSVNKRLGMIEYANNLGFDKVPRTRYSVEILYTAYLFGKRCQLRRTWRSRGRCRRKCG